jgi:hypothetical protein
MTRPAPPSAEPGPRARRRAARKIVDAYYQARLGELVDHVRSGLADQRDDVLAADKLLVRYARARRSLVKYCFGRGDGGHLERVATDLDLDPLAQHPIDWWALGDEPDDQSSKARQLTTPR